MAPNGRPTGERRRNMTPSRIKEIFSASLRLATHAHDPRARNLALLALERPTGLFQPEPTTALNRYPRLFRFVRDRLGDAPGVNILSFGCATGEEALSLRAYFPRAWIKGIDINGRNIAECRKKLEHESDPNLVFEVANSAAGEPDSRYDAIFAMAVFRHGNLCSAPERCDHLIRFVEFERSVAELARCLKPGGLLVFRHAHFRFSDTCVSRGFRQIFQAPKISGVKLPIYGTQDRLAPETPPDDGVFEKFGAANDRLCGSSSISIDAK